MFTALVEHGRVLVAVDQPASIGALAVAVARSMGIDVAYLPGLAMRRIAVTISNAGPASPLHNLGVGPVRQGGDGLIAAEKGRLPGPRQVRR